ncbi:hypothetical protein RO3G_06135 [Rhizopus delemar RA 99-880]|uniref:Small EDRK-rich factor-like N-terminal domain-containing protein n=1 Tax=Rhizopus delemar (strain RA 99-880 / ATCC MYA-4621 / FGSC 9543 / NRRL 43880) TaxID=246409 RepID=I1BZ00_RHIO9|nr:hypothetical protein RO3G_06135 [Rhizopus delemar RA 99-880]|eukprot:EIE81430.1 hypothetical protein RO3G_06135 [Rhizopus delemar RA 99-880]
MARGHQKEQARQKAQKEAAKRSAKGSQLGARAAGLQAKHPKDTIPSESEFEKK